MGSNRPRTRRSVYPWMLAGAIALTRLAHVSPAYADPTAADRETARSLMSEGDTNFDAKNYAQALKAYQAAHAIMGLPSTGYALARTQVALGLLVEGRDSAVLVTRMPVKPGERAPIVKARADAQKLADDLARRIGALQISVEGPPPSADVKVMVDGELVPSAALRLPRKANPGKHTVQASAPGFSDATQDVSLAEGQNANVSLTLTAGPGAVATADGGAAAASASTSSPFGSTQPPAADSASHKHLSPLVYVGFGVGAAGLITGTVTGIMHLSKVSSIKKDYCGGGTECSAGFDQKLDDARPVATVSDIAFGLGIVGIGVGVVALLTSSSSNGAAPASTATRAAPWVMPTVGLGSLGVRGAF